VRNADGQPRVTIAQLREFSDWEAQGSSPVSPHLIGEIIDRDKCHFSNCVAPWARGIAVASHGLLRKAGHQEGKGRPRGWREVRPGCFSRVIVLNFWDPTSLLVQRCGKQHLWTVERLPTGQQAAAYELLVHRFGSTPIFTRSHQSAMRLAMHCHADCPRELRWVKAVP